MEVLGGGMEQRVRKGCSKIKEGQGEKIGEEFRKTLRKRKRMKEESDGRG